MGLAKTSQRVGEVLTFFALLTLVVGVIGGGITFFSACAEMGSSDPAPGSELGAVIGIGIAVGSALQYAVLRLGSVLAFYVRDRYLGVIS